MEKDIDRELEADGPKDEGALNEWFQKIFAGADKDTRRAMNKSMQTSNGLVLSTNWAEVKEKVRFGVTVCEWAFALCLNLILSFCSPRTKYLQSPRTMRAKTALFRKEWT